MDHHVINAVSRGATTKGELHQNRLGGKIPAITYGSGKPARQLFIDESEFLAALSGITESTIIDLMVDGQKVQAFVKARQRASISHKIIHVDFLEITAGQILHARVPVRLVGLAVGIREGGILENPCHEIEVECDPSRLPEKIDLDISELHVNHSIHVRDIPAMEGVRVLTKADQVMVAIKYARGEETVAVETAAPAVATPAPGAAPAASAAPEKKAEKK